MQKGQAFVLTNNAFLLPHGASLVLVPFCGNGINSELVQPSFESPLVSGGKVNLKILEQNSIEKLFIISKANLSDVKFFFNSEVFATPENQDEMKIWISFSVYAHKGNWKVRYLNETVSGNDMLLKYLKVDQSIDLTTPCNKNFSAIDSLKSQANNVVSSKGSGEVKKSTSILAKSLANEGMSIFRRLKGKVSETTSQVKNQKFLDAACAVSAIVAYADGFASQDEISKLIAIIKSDDELRVYSENEVLASFERFIAGMKIDPIVGEGKAMTSISVFTGKPEANALLAFGLGIAMAEDGLDPSEQSAIERISNTLQVSADDMLGRFG